MNRQLTWSIVADGGTDRLLVPVIQWAMHRLDPDVEILEPEFRKRHGSIDASIGSCGSGAIPGRVLPVVIEHLRASDRRMRKSVTTTDIDEGVKKALDELESDAAQTEAVAGVLNAWRSRHDRKRSRGGRIDRVRDRPPSDRVLASRVPISSSKSHATIWGEAVKSFDDIPSPDAREVFRIISSVPGITEIKLGPFGHKGSRPTCQAWVGESPEPHVIEGKLYDRGEKGAMQSFQVRVQFDSDKPKVVAAIERKLRNSSKWAQSQAVRTRER